MQVKFAFNLKRVWDHYQSKSFAIISAYRSDLARSVNEQRAKDMKKAGRAMRYGYQEIKGLWKEELGSEAGKVTLEWPLFIPKISEDDAVILGRGQWEGGGNISQYSIIFADGEEIKELRVDVEPPVPIKRFSGLATNKPGKDASKALEKTWQGYSEHKQRPWAYVEWLLPEPPSKTGTTVGERRAASHWSDDDPHPFYHREDYHTKLLYHGAVYQRVDRRYLPVQMTALLRRRFRSPAFSGALEIPPGVEARWELDDQNVLQSTLKYRENVMPQKFSWHPISGEFLLSVPPEMHAMAIKAYGSYPFDEYVRGIVLPEQQTIAMRPWVPNFADASMTTGDPAEDRAQAALLEEASVESQQACKRALISVGGVPANWKWKFDVTNADLQAMTGIFRW